MNKTALWSAALVLALGLPLVASAADPDPVRSPWSAEQVGNLASELEDKAGRLEGDLRAVGADVKAETEDPDREVGVGLRTVLIQDLGRLGRGASEYREAIESGQGRDETRSLFGGVESQMSLTAADVRKLPDFAKYSDQLEAMEKTVAALGLFYAEKIEVTTPPDPLKQ